MSIRPRALVGCPSWHPHLPTHTAAAKRSTRLHGASVTSLPSPQQPQDNAGWVDEANQLDKQFWSELVDRSEEESVWDDMQKLQIIRHTVHVEVERVNSGGLLVRYEGYEGLGFLPRSQLSSELRKEELDSLVGRSLPVMFLDVDELNKRLIFSNKYTRKDMESIRIAMKGLQVGDVVTGVVQSVRYYGALLASDQGAVGLLHVSQISHDRVYKVEHVLKQGDRLKVLVFRLDPDRGRITFSTKKLEPSPGDMLRDTQLVFDKAEEMGEAFRKRIKAPKCIGKETLSCGKKREVTRSEACYK